MELPRSQNPAHQSQWKFTAAHQNNLAWESWVTCQHILPFEVIKIHASENPLMTQQRSQRTEVFMSMNHALPSSVLAIINKNSWIFRQFSQQCKSLSLVMTCLLIVFQRRTFMHWIKHWTHCQVIIILYLDKKPKTTLIYILLTQIGFSLLLVF